MAVLKINSSVVNQVATFGNSDNIKVGETSLAIGSPMGSSYASSLTQGIISAKKNVKYNKLVQTVKLLEIQQLSFKLIQR